MNISEIQSIHGRGSAIVNKIYICKDEAGRIRYWIGTVEKRLREISDSEAAIIQNKSVQSTENSTTVTSTPTGAAGGSNADYTNNFLLMGG